MKKVLITGASSGIGLELSKLFGKQGYNLVLVARRKEKLLELKEKLEESYNVQVQVEALDLSDLSNIEKLSDKYSHINILINNAGFGKYSAFLDYPEKTDFDMIKLNLTVPTLMIKKFAKSMKKESIIMNIASTAGHQPVPYMACYSACKSFLIDFSIAVSKEIKDIHILCYSPGETKTEFQTVAQRPKSSILRGPIPTASQVADDIYSSIVNKKPYTVYGFYNKLLLFFSKFFSKNKIAEGIAKNNERL